jgi:hypothetical protein
MDDETTIPGRVSHTAKNSAWGQCRDYNFAIIALICDCGSDEPLPVGIVERTVHG